MHARIFRSLTLSRGCPRILGFFAVFRKKGQDLTRFRAVADLARTLQRQNLRRLLLETTGKS